VACMENIKNTYLFLVRKTVCNRIIQRLGLAERLSLKIDKG